MNWHKILWNVFIGILFVLAAIAIVASVAGGNSGFTLR